MKLVIGDNQTSNGRNGFGGSSLMYHVQSVLVLVGLILTIVAFFVALTGHANWPSIAGILATLVAYASIIYYCVRGYRESDTRYYLGAVYCVSAMLFFKTLVPLHTMLSEGLLTLAFGLLLVFAERMDRPKQARKIILVVLALLVAETITVLFMPLDAQLTSLQGFFVRAMPLTSLLLGGVLANIYQNNIAK